MSTRNIIPALILSATFWAPVSLALADSPNLGQVATPQQIAVWDTSIGPDGAGLPAGHGTAMQGEAVYNEFCLGCHGEKGVGKPNDRLVGGQGTLAGDQVPVKTVGSYWPYATTLFDYTRRAMPWNAPKSLSDEQVYAVTAYILALNGIIGTNDEVNAQTLPKVQMPNRDGFVIILPERAVITPPRHSTADESTSLECSPS
jgi:mono/diheme cytochrome c family protein